MNTKVLNTCKLNTTNFHLAILLVKFLGLYRGGPEVPNQQIGVHFPPVNQGRTRCNHQGSNRQESAGKLYPRYSICMVFFGIIWLVFGVELVGEYFWLYLVVWNIITWSIWVCFWLLSFTGFVLFHVFMLRFILLLQL